MARRQHRDHYDRDGGYRDHRTGRGRSKDNTLWWVAGAVVLAIAGGGTAASTTGNNHPVPKSTVCTQYFKGGC